MVRFDPLLPYMRNSEYPLIGTYPDQVFSKYNVMHVNDLHLMISAAIIAHGNEPQAVFHEVMLGMKEKRIAVTSMDFIFDCIHDQLQPNTSAQQDATHPQM